MMPYEFDFDKINVPYVSYLFNFDITFVAFCFQFNWLRRENIYTG